MANKYFKAPTDAPSGIKGALVVGESEALMLEEALPRTTDRYEIHFWLNFKYTFIKYIS